MTDSVSTRVSDTGRGLSADTAYETILKELLTGRHQPGDRIREEDVAVRIGTSRTPVREALRRLASEGLVELRSNRGAVVPESSLMDVDELFDLRAMLEGYGASRAAARRTAEELQHFVALCENMERAARDREYGRLTALNIDFHRGIAAASRIDRLVSMVAGLIAAPLVRETFRHYERDDLSRSMSQHRELVSALEVGDADWVQATMCAHLYAAKASIVRDLQIDHGASKLRTASRLDMPDGSASIRG